MNFFKYCPWDGYRFAEVDKDCFICKKPRYRIQEELDKQTPKKQWQRILYEQQEYDDNYIDETFLSGVVTQDNSANGPNYRDLINKSADLIFAINSVAAYLIMYIYMLQKIVPAEGFIGLLSLMSVLGTFTYILLKEKTFNFYEILSNLKNIVIIIAILLLFSPVFLTINQTYADNTIYALTTFCILFHLLLRDYDCESKVTPSNWNVDISTYAALGFASLLSSRLTNEKEVFVMLYGTLIYFIFAVFLKKSIKEYSLRIFKFSMISTTIIVGVQLYSYSLMLAFTYVAVIFFITFISPLQIIWLYQYKNTIQGPWDLPKVRQYD